MVRKSDYNIWVVFNKDTVEYPQKLSKTKKAELIQLTSDKVWKEIMKQEKDKYYLKSVPAHLRKYIHKSQQK